MGPRILRYGAPPEDLADPEFDLGLFLLNDLLLTFRQSLQDFGLPSYQHEWHQLENNRLIVNELDYSPAEQERLRAERYEQLNKDQKQAFDKIVAAITENPRSAQLFLQGAGGTGKIFLYTALRHHFRAQGKNVLCVASSGIAAELLPSGRTSHSRFQIPLNLHQDSTPMITGTSHAADLMRRTALIINHLGRSAHAAQSSSSDVVRCSRRLQGIIWWLTCSAWRRFCPDSACCQKW